MSKLLFQCICPKTNLIDPLEGKWSRGFCLLPMRMRVAHQFGASDL
jgi:hypothetical protein